MAKKQSIVPEIGSALGAAAARTEKLVPSKPAKKTTTPAAKPTAKRTAAAKHSTTTASKPAPKPAAAKTKAAAKPVLAVKAEIVISHEEIAKQAYFYWEARGCQGGDPVEDWARAEAELKQRLG